MAKMDSGVESVFDFLFSMSKWPINSCRVHCVIKIHFHIRSAIRTVHSVFWAVEQSLSPSGMVMHNLKKTESNLSLSFSTSLFSFNVNCVSSLIYSVCSILFHFVQSPKINCEGRSYRKKESESFKLGNFHSTFFSKFCIPLCFLC